VNVVIDRQGYQSRIKSGVSHIEGKAKSAALDNAKSQANGTLCPGHSHFADCWT
jgi:hypothetical protein